MQAALGSLRGRRLGLVGDAPPGFTPSQYDGELLQRLFGIEIDEIPVESMFECVDAVSDVEAEAEHAAAVDAQPSLAAVDGGQALTSARITTAMRGWRDR